MRMCISQIGEPPHLQTRYCESINDDSVDKNDGDMDSGRGTHKHTKNQLA